MRTLFLALILLSQTALLAQGFKELPYVDERVELLSIIFRLAETPGYAGNKADPKYENDINAYFGKYSQHPAVIEAKKLTEEKSIAYDAVMSFSIYLDQPPSLKPLISFNKSLPEERWEVASANKFAALVKKFYKDTNFNTFFNQHKAYYDFGAQKLAEALKEAKMNWFESFYGKDNNRKRYIVFSPANGIHNYGVRIVLNNGVNHNYAILCSGIPDTPGIPVFNERSIELMVHEFNHSYYNPLVDKYIDQFSTFVPALFDKVKTVMSNQAYTSWQAMLYESLVRTGELRYLDKYDSVRKIKKIREEKNNGFLWIQYLDSAFNNYETNRTKYRNIEDYMPELIKAYQVIAQNKDVIIQAEQSKYAHFSGLSEFNNKDTSVDASLTEISIQFDKAMKRPVSINPGELGQEGFPITGAVGWSADKKSLRLKVKLLPGRAYEFILTDKSFESEEGYPIKPATIYFKTRE